ncbi:MAG: hypothetical protein ACXAEF_10990 [Candidatus Thorarchaeota archaeon]|jgi:uncharacterized membrane protein
MRNKVPFLLCLAGGIILWMKELVGSIGVFEYLEILYGIPELADFVPIIQMLLYILGIIAAAGGLSVIVGGYLMTTARFGMGKFIVGIGAGMGLIGLIIDLAKLFYVSGAAAVFNLLVLLSQSMGWIAIIVTIVARQIAKKPE